MSLYNGTNGIPYTLGDYKPLVLLCGATASFDTASGIAYRCNSCGAVVNSIGMPKRCKELYEMEKVIDKLKGTK